MQPKPHISQAVKGLRRWVILCASVVTLACLTQALIFGMVYYTDVRQETVVAAPPKELRVVESRDRANQPVHTGPKTLVETGNAAPLLGPGSLMDTHTNVVGGVRANLLADSKPIDPNLVTSAWDAYLRRTSMTAVGIGAVATMVLCALSFMGTVIAGGASIPGVEKSVTATFWSMVLASLVLPWKDIMPSLPVPGIFAPYDSLISAAETARAGGSAAYLFAQWLVLPMLAGLAATMVATWFCAGVRRGIIVTSVSELDRQIEKEVANINKRGVANSGPRAIGALNRAIGDSTEESVASLEAVNGMAKSLVREATPTISEPLPERSHAGRHPGRLI